MTKEEQIKDWFIHQFWPVYPGKWCRSGKGGRQEALNAFLKKTGNADPEELARILGNLKAQIKADKGNENRKWWVIGKTYCNNESWEDPVEDDLEPETHPKYCQCGQPREIKMECMKCYNERTENKQIHMQNLKDLELLTPGISLSELANRCREYLQTSGASGKLLEKMTSSLKPADSGNQ